MIPSWFNGTASECKHITHVTFEASRGAVARGVTVKPIGCGFDPHSRR